MCIISLAIEPAFSVYKVLFSQSMAHVYFVELIFKRQIYFNFSLIIFVDVTGTQITAKAIVEQSICFDSIVKMRYSHVTIHFFMPEGH